MSDLEAYLNKVDKNITIALKITTVRSKDLRLLLDQYIQVMSIMDQATPNPKIDVAAILPKKPLPVSPYLNRDTDWRTNEGYLYPLNKRIDPKRRSLMSKTRNYHPYGFELSQVERIRQKFWDSHDENNP